MFMRNLFVNFFLIAFIITILSKFGYAILEEQEIEIEVNVSENYSTYLIKWKVYVDVNYYYPAGSEFEISLPKDYEIISVKDDLEDVYFKIYNSSLIVYNRRSIHHGDNYIFYITIKQNSNPIYYNNSFYFKPFYSSIPMKINLPEWATDIKILSGKEYRIKSNSIFTIHPIFISFGGKEILEEKLNLSLLNINAEIPKRYIDKLLVVLDKIDKYYWNRFEEMFSSNLEKINFNLVTNEKEDWICYYNKNYIFCSIEILFYDEEQMVKTIVHEITHHFVSYILGNGLPPWIEEGIAEKISYELGNFTINEMERSRIIKECINILNNNFWNSWECEKFNNCNTTYYSNDSCISKYGLGNLRYIFSLDIVNKTLDLENIKEISKFFLENNISISESSKNKDSVAIFLIYLFGKNYEEIENYKINFEGFERIKETYNSYIYAKEKINDYSENLPPNSLDKANSILKNSLNIIFNGRLDEAANEINRALEIAEEIRITAENIKENIENIEDSLNSCYYSIPLSLISIARESYENGEFDKSIEYINEALRNKEIMDKRVYNIKVKIENLKSSLAGVFFSEKMKELENEFKNCRIEEAEEEIRKIETNFKIIIYSITISLFSTILILFYFVFRKKSIL